MNACRAGMLGTLALALAACEPPAPPVLEGRLELRRAALRCGRLEITVTRPPGHPLHDLARELAEDVRAEARLAAGGFPGEVEVRAPGEASGPAHEAVRLWIGCGDDDGARRWAAAVGVELLPEGGFRARGRHYRAPADAVLATGRDPDHPRRPLLVLLGNDAEALARRRVELPAPWRTVLRTWADDGPACSFERLTLGDPAPLDRSLVRAALPWERAVRVPVNAGPGADAAAFAMRVRAQSGVDPGRLEAYLGACASAAARAARWLGAVPAEALEVRVYASVAAFEAATGNGGLGWVDGGSLGVHAVLAPALPDDGGAAVAHAVALAVAGRSTHPWLDAGVGVAAAGTWYGRPLDAWLALLRAGGLLPAGDAARAPGARLRWSPHALVPAWARDVRALAATGGDGGLAPLWRASADVPPAPADEDAAALPPELAEERAARRAAVLADPLVRGLALVEQRVPPPPGTPHPYGGPRLGVALDALQAAGAAACALWVSAGTGDPGRLRAGGDLPWSDAGDAALLAAAAAAGERDLLRMLVLRPLEARGGSWADGPGFTRPEDFDQLFRRLERLVVHYGLLAELGGLELYCFATGLDHASRTVATGEENQYQLAVLDARRRGWARLVEGARAAFGGAITYGAELGQEADRIAFWDALDVIGLQGFGPLRRQDFPTEGEGAPDDRTLRVELRREFRKALRLAEEHGRPALFVQLGFPARGSSWRDWSWGLGLPSAGAQERYHAVLRSVLEDRPPHETAVGFFLWEWPLPFPSLPGLEPFPWRATPSRGADYGIAGRPAAAHLEALLRRH